MDLYEEGNEYVVKLAVPGVKPDNFEITLHSGPLCRTLGVGPVLSPVLYPIVGLPERVANRRMR